MSAPLPEFSYHPDPVATGVVAPSPAVCACCGQARGMLYTGPVLDAQSGATRARRDEGDDGQDEPAAPELCPWCVADGRAHAELGVVFVAPAAVGGYGEWETVDDDVVAEISQRTPCFRGWQQERWFTCCGDGAVFLGPAGWRDIQAHGEEAVRAIQRESGFEGEDWEGYFAEIERDGEVRAYLFRCRHCAAIGGYSDCE